MNTVSENHPTRRFQWLGLAGIFLLLAGCASTPKCYEGDRYESGFCYKPGGDVYQVLGTHNYCPDSHLYNSHYHLCYDRNRPDKIVYAYDPQSFRYCVDGYLYRVGRCHERNHLDSFYYSYNPDGVCADNYKYKDGVCNNTADCDTGYQKVDGVCYERCEYTYELKYGVCHGITHHESYVPSAYALPPETYDPGPATIQQQSTQQVIAPQRPVKIVQRRPVNIAPKSVPQPVIQQTIIQNTTVVTPPPVVQPARPPSQPIRPPSQPARSPAPAAKPPAESSREDSKPSKQPERKESKPKEEDRRPTAEPARSVTPSQAIRKR